MKGWFDAFREEGGPTLYAYHNRTAVAADVPALALLLAALTLYIAFLAIFPGIRKEVNSQSMIKQTFVCFLLLVSQRPSCCCWPRSLHSRRCRRCRYCWLHFPLPRYFSGIKKKVNSQLGFIALTTTGRRSRSCLPCLLPSNPYPCLLYQFISGKLN